VLRAAALALLAPVALLLALAGVAPAGAQTKPAEPPAAVAKPLPAGPSPIAPADTSFVPDRDYRIGPEDVLDISVWREEGLKQTVLVRPDGGISFPLIGDVMAAGRTVEELRDEIGKRLDKFVPGPVVSVAVTRVASHRIYVIGRVNKPGDFPAGRFVDVLQVLTMAGGLTPFASENGIQIIRREGGKQIVIPFRFGDVRRGVNLEQNILLRAGDTVLVP
jgi:polysaccharide export outer membrane protein